MQKVIVFLVISMIGVSLPGCGGSTEVPAANANVDTGPANSPVAASGPANSFANNEPAIPEVTQADGKPAKPASYPAPEDSEFTMQLTDVGIETRTFKNHPQLVKVEKRITPDAQTIKIYLKSGKVVEVAGDKLGPIRTESTSRILAAAGIQPVAQPSSPKSKEEQIEEEKKKLESQ